MSNPVAVPGTNVPSGSGVTPGGAQGVQGLTGPAGPYVVSTDSGNLATLGSDNRFYVPSNSYSYYSTAGGSANAITLTNGPPIQALRSGMVFTFTATARNTGATTINVDGLGAYSLVYSTGSAMVGGEINASSYVTVVFAAGSQFVIVKSYSDRKFWWTSVIQFSGSLANPTLNTSVAVPLTLGTIVRGVASDFSVSSNNIQGIRDGFITATLSPDRALLMSRLSLNNAAIILQSDAGPGAGSTPGSTIYVSVSCPSFAGTNTSVNIVVGTACNLTVSGVMYLF